MPHRLENLRKALTLNWGELAAKLEISRAMLDFIRTGARNPSPRVLRKIEQAEIEAGLRGGRAVRDSPVDYGASGLNRAALEEMGGIKKELDALSRRVEDFIKRHE